ncbi:MAG: GTPase Era [Symbiobacteriaceae bacterium]|nr:GTPase Era [Symbiobacteriaceae bacterium]
MTELLLHSGFVALLGRSNVGKSTLLNQMMGTKLSIVSEKPQTTRNRIPCILTWEEGQAVFLDTPGVHTPQNSLGERMNQYAWASLAEVELILFLTTADSRLPGAGDQRIVEQLKSIPAPIYLIINKIDLAEEETVTSLQDTFFSKLPWAGIFRVSALTGEGVAELKESICQELPPGPQYYPSDIVIDQPERFLVAEIIREKVLQLTRDEVPHGIAVDVEKLEEPGEKGLVKIQATIYTDRESPKGIIIGSKGAKLKEIGSLARQELELLFGCQVFLELWVKVRPRWRNNQQALNSFGYARVK